MSFAVCRVLKRPDKVCTRQHDNVGSEPYKEPEMMGWTLYFPTAISKRIGRTSGIVKDETLSGRV